jgi:hypothetical protein
MARLACGVSVSDRQHKPQSGVSTSSTTEGGFRGFDETTKNSPSWDISNVTCQFQGR